MFKHAANQKQGESGRIEESTQLNSAENVEVRQIGAAILDTALCRIWTVMRVCTILAVLLFIITTSCSKQFSPVENSSDQNKLVNVSEPQLLVENGKHAKWSPDDQWIAYALYSGSSTDIYIASKDGGDARQITNDISNEEQPFWSPDGSAIGFSSNTGEKQYHTIFTMVLDSNKITQATPDTIGVQSGDWSADGRHVVFDGVRKNKPANSIFIIELMSRQLISLATNLAYAGRPQFSPDGAKIVFEALEHNSQIYNIWTMNSDGTELKQITTDGGEYPCWSPDGNKIAYSNNRTGNYDLYIIDSNGGQPIQLTHSKETNEVRASWSSSEEYIIYDTMMGSENVTPQNAGIYVIKIEFIARASK